MLNIFYSVIAGIASLFMMLYGVVGGINNFDTIPKYKENVAAFEPYENTLETAIPQTEIYNIITEHFNAPLAEGKTVKKAIVLGYDGGRADALSLADENGAVYHLITTGGTANIGYCGGVNYPAFNTQDTSTAPGWCSILTGQWADVHGITGNSIVKSTDTLTLLTTLVEDGKAEDSAFYVSWGGHFSADDSTYILEKAYCEEKGLDVTFSRAGDDNGTFENTYNDVTSADCSDFIFTIFEYPDHYGHDTGFDLENPDYAQAFADNDAAAMEIIKAIEARDTYETEDWLIILTSDHGGFNTGHGSFTIQERMTFIVVR